MRHVALVALVALVGCEPPPPAHLTGRDLCERLEDEQCLGDASLAECIELADEVFAEAGRRGCGVEASAWGKCLWYPTSDCSTVCEYYDQALRECMDEG